MEDPEYRRLGDDGERMIRAHRHDDGEALQRIWDNLTVREQRMVLRGMIALVVEYRNELGHPPDATYGPELI